MSRNKSGCVFSIIVIAVCIGSIALMGSQWSLIRNARKSHLMSDYELYLNNYPEGRYSSEAYESILRLWDAMEIIDLLKYSSVSMSSSYIDKYNDLYTKYDDTLFQSRLYDKMRIKCLKQYQSALQVNTLEGWNRYLIYIPEEFYFDAQNKYDSLYDEIWGTEESAWKYVCEMNTIDDYEEYEILYPQGRHYSEAEKRAVGLRVDDLFGNKHGDLPPMEKTSKRDGRKSTVQVTNSTSYTLTVFYSGNDGKRIVLSSHETQTIELLNGVYRIAASVDASNVRPYAGTEEIAGGNYAVEYIIESKWY